MTSNGERKISSLRDLPLDIAPPRDLWQGIEARIAAEAAAKDDSSAPNTVGSVSDSGAGTRRPVSADMGAGGTGGTSAGAGGARDVSAGPGTVRDLRTARRQWRPARMQMLAAAAVIAALAIGIWIGRAVLPGPDAGTTGGGLTASNTQPKAVAGQSTGKGPSGAQGVASAVVGKGESGAWPSEYFMDARYVRQRAELVKGLESRIAALPPDSRAKVLASLKAINDSKRDLEAALGKDPSNALLQELLVNTYQDEMRVLTAVHEAGNTAEGT